MIKGSLIFEIFIWNETPWIMDQPF